MNKSLLSCSDEELMQRVNEQDQSAFTILVKRHASRFYPLAYRMLFSKTEAEDIVQEAFLKIWKGQARWHVKGNAKFTTWFYRIIVNACYDKNKKKQLSTTSLNDIDTEYEPSLIKDDLDTMSQSERAEIALKMLPERQRMAINLCFFDELSNQEAADIMGVSKKALQSLITRGKSTLKSILLSEEERNNG